MNERANERMREREKEGERVAHKDSEIKRAIEQGRR